MASIDEVIARAQRGGQFGQRKQFTLETSRAIEKLRKFGLAEPHYYILELIQGAVANGAEYLDIQSTPEHLQISYVGTGSGFTKERLEGLFDALLTPQANEENTDLRALAIGFNALCSLGTQEIVMESGDGSPEGSHRLELGNDSILVGRTSSALHGTFILVKGDRQKGHKIEEDLILERCISSTIPLCFNGRFLFTTRGDKFPLPFGYKKCLRFDEGDLYGTVGVNSLSGRRGSFKLIVNGVHLWSFESPHQSENDVGGIICFNRLKKTVDQADVVRDETWDELWVRVDNYVRVVLGLQKTVPKNEVHVIGDAWPTPLRRIKQRLTGVKTVVALPPGATERETGRGSIIAEQLDGLLATVPHHLLQLVSSQLAPGTQVIAPSLGDSSVMRFFCEPLAALVPPGNPNQTLPTLPFRRQKQELEEIHFEYRALLSGRNIEGQLFFQPFERSVKDGIQVRLISFGRELWKGLVESVHRGICLDAYLPGTTPAQVQELYGEHNLAMALVQAWQEPIADFAASLLRKVEDTTVAPLSNGAHLVLSRLEGEVGLTFDQKDKSLVPRLACAPEELQLVKTATLQTLSQKKRPLGDLEGLLRQGRGLVYGVYVDRDGQVDPQADLDDLDANSILVLDRVTENALVSILGPAAFIRVDARETLAQSGHYVLRDVALGLRSYPSRCLLVESILGAKLTRSKIAPHQKSLLKQLLGPVQELLKSAMIGSLTTPSADVVEWLRHAVRHLQFAAVRANEIELDEDIAAELRGLPLFAADLGIVSLSTIRQRCSLGLEISILDGKGEDVVDHALCGRVKEIEDPAVEFSLVMNPFAVELLKPWLVPAAVEVNRRLLSELSPEEGGAIVSVSIDEEKARGEIGVAPAGTPAYVMISHPSGKLTKRSGNVRGLRLLGSLHLLNNCNQSQLLNQAVGQLLPLLLATCMVELDSPSKRIAAVDALLDYSLVHTRWTLDHQGSTLHLNSEAVEGLFALPFIVLQSGQSVTPAQVVELLQADPFGALSLSSQNSETVKLWVQMMALGLQELLNSVDKAAYYSAIPTKPKASTAGATPEEFAAGAAPEEFAAPTTPEESAALTTPREPRAKHVQEWVEESQRASSVTEEKASPQGQSNHPAAEIEQEPTEVPSLQELVTIGTLLAPVAPIPSTVDFLNVDARVARLPPTNVEHMASTSTSVSGQKPPAASRAKLLPIVDCKPRGDLREITVALAMQKWLNEFCPVKRVPGKITVHIRVVHKYGWFGGTTESVTPRIPPQVQWHDPPKDKSLRLGPNGYISDARTWVVRAHMEQRHPQLAESRTRLAIVFNRNTKLLQRALQDFDELEQLFPSLLLAAYSAANYRFAFIEREHEALFQSRVLDHLLNGKSFFERRHEHDSLA